MSPSHTLISVGRANQIPQVLPMPSLVVKPPGSSRPLDSFLTSLSGKAPKLTPFTTRGPASGLQPTARTMNRGEELKDEWAVQHHDLAQRGGRPAGEVVPHLAAACGVKAEDTCQQMGTVTILPLLSLEGLVRVEAMPAQAAEVLF